MEKRQNVHHQKLQQPFEDTDNIREQKRKNGKKYLKYSICASFGIAVCFISDNLIEALLLLGLFCAYILCTD